MLCKQMKMFADIMLRDEPLIFIRSLSIFLSLSEIQVWVENDAVYLTSVRVEKVGDKTDFNHDIIGNPLGISLWNVYTKDGDL